MPASLNWISAVLCLVWSTGVLANDSRDLALDRGSNASAAHKMPKGSAASPDLERVLFNHKGQVQTIWREDRTGETLSSLMEEALRANPDIMEQRSRLDAAGFDLETAEWERYPQFSADAEAVDGDDEVFVARLEQPIWAGGQISSEIELGRARKSAAMAALEEVQLGVMIDVAAAYYEILRLNARMQIASISETELQHLVNTIDRRVKAQISPTVAHTQAQARYFQAVREQVQIRQSLVQARSVLERLLARPVGKLASSRPIPLGALSLQEIDHLAQRHSPTLHRLRAEISVAQADIKKTRTGWMPRVVIGVQAQSTRDQDLDDPNLYVAMRMQSGPGLSNLSSVKAAGSRKLAAQSALRAEEQDLTRQIQSSWAVVEGLSGQVDAVRSLNEAAGKLVASYLRQFRVGKKSWLDVLNAQREKTNAHIALADTIYPLLSARVSLLLLAGELDVNNAKHKL